MYRKIVFFLLIGMIARAEMFNLASRSRYDQPDSDLAIVLTSNNGDEIEHQPVEFETLKLIKNVDGLLHYSMGARLRSK